MNPSETILAFIKAKGPIIPVQISKEIKDSILMASARLSELLGAKKIKISSLKVGGSPLYYLAGQEEMLQGFAGNLSHMEKKAYDLLSQSKVLQDSAQEPAVRVALRQVKDFAVPLNVTYNDKKEVFWKWYLFGNNEAESIIKEALSKAPVQKQIIEERALVPSTAYTEKKAIDEKLASSESQKTLLKKEAIKKPKQPEDKGHEKRVMNFFTGNKISVIESAKAKKSSDLEFIVDILTSIGGIKYFCKYRGKKSINEADLSSALVQAQSKNLPLLFLSSGVLTKKAQEMLNKELKNIIFKKL
ncbi:MAG: hypothetical protein AABX34_01610 [Nanoarchaeota archaeon]